MNFLDINLTTIFFNCIHLTFFFGDFATKRLLDVFLPVRVVSQSWNTPAQHGTCLAIYLNNIIEHVQKQTLRSFYQHDERLC